jgi:hypothetical protein
MLQISSNRKRGYVMTSINFKISFDKNMSSWNITLNNNFKFSLFDF